MLELTSNTIKVLGIFGRYSEQLESQLDLLEQKYSSKPQGSDEYDIFRHLTLTFIPDATVSQLSDQLSLLKELKKFLPLRLKVLSVFVKDEESLEGAQHIAIEIGLEQTSELVEFIKSRVDEYAVATHYIKTLWFVPNEHQAVAIEELSKINEIEFTDFYLVSNKQDYKNTIYRSSQFS